MAGAQVHWADTLTRQPATRGPKPVAPPPKPPDPRPHHPKADPLTYDPATDPDPIPAYYAAQTRPPPPTATLHGSHTADVAIIGAGYTGLSTALHLAEAGVSTIVLEAREIGQGASSRNFGQVVPYLKPTHDGIEAAFPPDTAERIITRVGNGPATVFALIDRHRI